MPENALVAALLTQAAEHRLKAESLRNCKMDEENRRFGGWLGDILIHMNDRLEAEAREQDGLAEVYEGFAKRILGEDYWVQWNWVTHDSYLVGPVALFNAPLKFEPEAFQVTSGYDRQWWERYMDFYQGLDLPGSIINPGTC